MEHLRAYGLRYFNRFAIYQLKEDYKRDAYRDYMAGVLRLCALSLGCEIEQQYGDIIAAVEHPEAAQPVLTPEEAEDAWQEMLEDSRRMTEQWAAENGGDDV